MRRACVALLRGEKWLDDLLEADYGSCFGKFIDSRARRSVEIEVMVSIAGGLAEMEALGLGNDLSSGMGLTPYWAGQRAALISRTGDVPEDLVHLSEDDGLVSILAEKVSGSLDKANAYILWLEQRTRNLIQASVVHASGPCVGAVPGRAQDPVGSRGPRHFDAAIEAAFPLPKEWQGHQNGGSAGD